MDVWVNKGVCYECFRYIKLKFKIALSDCPWLITVCRVQHLILF